MMSKKHARWHKLRKQSADDVSVGPIITSGQVKRLYQDTELGSPVDTVEEWDGQKHNLGPKNTLTELHDLLAKSRKHDSPKPKDDELTEQDHQPIQPKPRR